MDVAHSAAPVLTGSANDIGLSRDAVPASGTRICSDCPSPISRCSKGRCRGCAQRRLNSDPAIVAHRKARIAAHAASPEGKAKLRANMKHSLEKMSEAAREARRERGKVIYRDVLNRPDVREKSNSADAKRRAGAARTETLLGWCPPHLRDEYRALCAGGNVRAAEARKLIEQQMARDEARRVAAMSPFERQMERVAAGAQLVAAFSPRLADHDYTMAGVTDYA